MRAVWLRSSVKKQNISDSKLTSCCETNQYKLTYFQSVLTSDHRASFHTSDERKRKFTFRLFFFFCRKATESTEIQEYCETRKDCVIVIETDFAPM